MTSPEPFRIGIDLMGSERAPEVLFEAFPAALKRLPGHCTLVVFATSEVLARLPSDLPSIEFHPVSEVITMDDAPLSSVRQRKGSSIVTGVRQVAEHTLHAFISAGNTGALIASASILLPQIAGFGRPALLASMPTRNGPMAVLDVGGNVACKAEHLVQFARMGAIYQSLRRGIIKPRVGLLNIGTESQKGTAEHREAYEILMTNPQTHFTFVGNVEGRSVFDGEVDVLVTDGFTGNIFLKTSEGVSAFLLDYLRDIMGNVDVLQNISEAINHDNASGAVICGVNGIVIKCHGVASSQAFVNAILEAVALIQSDWLQQMKSGNS